ncbi:MAG: hypothetical protein KDA21_03865 [Phycisphaerales bacterium]|nr:hypothetical protein [Phycisphaerales bacterium]
MKSRQLQGLIALNLVLLAALAMVTLGPAAFAQTARPARAAGDYGMVTGKAQGITENVVYVVDGINRDLVAIKWDRSRKGWEGLGYANLTEDAQRGGRRSR